MFLVSSLLFLFGSVRQTKLAIRHLFGAHKYSVVFVYIGTIHGKTCLQCFELPSVLLHCRLGGRKGIRPVKNVGGWWRWALVSPDGVTPNRMVCVSVSVNLPFTINSRSFVAPTHLGEPGKRAIKWLWWCGVPLLMRNMLCLCLVDN